eukprot:6428785-Pyramimonas_sp.AAC.1
MRGSRSGSMSSSWWRMRGVMLSTMFSVLMGVSVCAPHQTRTVFTGLYCTALYCIEPYCPPHQTRTFGNDE